MNREKAKEIFEREKAASQARWAALTPEQRSDVLRQREDRRRQSEAEDPFLHPEMWAAWYDCGPFEMVGRAWCLARVAIRDLASGGRVRTEVRWNKKGCCCQIVTRFD